MKVMHCGRHWKIGGLAELLWMCLKRNQFGRMIDYVLYRRYCLLLIRLHLQRKVWIEWHSMQQ